MPTVDIFGIPHTYNLSANPYPSSASASSPAASTGPETLVFIHGWLLSQVYWQPLVTQLSEDYRTLTYDMRGFGGSVLPDLSPDSQAPRDIHLPPGKSWYPSANNDSSPYNVTPYSLAAYAHDLGKLLDHLGLENVWLMGHSLGGSVALWSAYLFPQQVKGVICLNAGGGIYIPNEFEKFRAAGQQMVKFRPAWLPNVPLLPRVFTQAMVHKKLDIRWGQQRVKDFVRADRDAAKGALLESTTAEEVHQLPKLVGQLEQPVHFITASQDTVMLPRYVNYLASFHSQFAQETMVSEIPDCGHMAMVEQPEAVEAIVREVISH